MWVYALNVLILIGFFLAAIVWLEVISTLFAPSQHTLEAIRMDFNRIVLSFIVVHHRHRLQIPSKVAVALHSTTVAARFALLVELIYHSLNKLYWVIDLSVLLLLLMCTHVLHTNPHVISLVFATHTIHCLLGILIHNRLLKTPHFNQIRRKSFWL